MSVDLTYLDASRLTKFSPDTMIGEVIDNLMVEQWDTVGGLVTVLKL